MSGARTDVSGAQMRSGARFRVVWIRNFREGIFMEVGGARKLQMRCGFRPRDRDRTL